MTGAATFTALLIAGSGLIYASHPNQRLAQAPLPGAYRYTGYVLLLLATGGWVWLCGYRAGLFIVVLECMLGLAILPLLTLLRRPAP